MYAYKQDSLNSWKTMSEQDIVSRYCYEPVFTTLFEDPMLSQVVSLNFSNPLNDEAYNEIYVTVEKQKARIRNRKAFRRRTKG